MKQGASQNAAEQSEQGDVTAEDADVPGPIPNDPMNPLNAAYDMKAYELLRKLRLDEDHQISQDSWAGVAVGNGKPMRTKQLTVIFKMIRATDQPTLPYSQNIAKLVPLL